MSFFLIILTPWILYLGFSKPSYFVLIFIAFSMCRMEELVPAFNSLPIPFIMALLTVLSLARQVALNKTTLFWTTEMSYFSAFFIWVTLGVFVSYDFSNAFDYWYSSFTKLVLGFFLITWTMDSKKDFLLYLTTVVISGLIASSITVYNHYYGIALMGGTRTSINMKLGVIGDPNDLSLFLLIPFSITLTMFASNYLPFIVRWTGLLLSLFITYSISITQSRGGLLGLAGICIYFFYTKTKSKKLTIFLGGLLVISLYLFAHLDERMGGGGGLDDSANYRLEAWKAALRMSLHHPLFGVGLDNFSDSFYNFSSGIVKYDMVAHNSWLSVLAETGFLGFYLFIKIVYLVFKSISNTITQLKETINTHKDSQVFLTISYSVLFGLIGYCISGTFLSQGLSWFFFTPFAITLSLAQTTKKLLADKKVSSANNGV